MTWQLAIRSIRAHPGSGLASMLVLLAGAALLTAFASLLETGLGTTESGSTTLVMLPAILGGWTVAVVIFGVVSTVALAIQHREREIALLRSIAATPQQIRRGLLVETILTALPAVALGILPGIGLGAFLLARLADADLIASSIELRIGWLGILIGIGTPLLAAVAAALIASRRAAAIPPVRALSEAAPASPLASTRILGRGRVISGAVLLVIGVSLAVTTLFMPNGPMLSSTAGPGGVAAAVGLALLSPMVLAGIGRFTDARIGALGRLAARNLQARIKHTATVAAPLILLVGIAAGTLYMQTTEDSVTTSGTDDVGSRLATVNYLVVIMITGFAAIVVTNTLIAATRSRRREFGLLRLAVATRRQVLLVLTIETAVTTALAAVLGTIAAAATTVPYSLVKTGSPMASGPAWIYLAIIGGAFLLALLATVPTAVRMLRTSPIQTLIAS